ncbi:N-acyl homoserine lactonase family protein [Amycolatopsis sp. K13G38]|uniref:N-acyl homoserine lactonase family protein n=1 Tax=Amycolatopsis acididurans TaxID=2724524 RepID=A0ABX1IVJ0_9PSEU|nr:N-acyl homoserine lactonase family protein [Amycolatopsis acididurans]NKQ51329.1 N-acyl homoserine lactonase family protein [Amycolatopsis acididurans]
MTVLDIAGTPRGVYRFVLGYEPIPEAMSVHGGDPARFLLEPVTAAAVCYDEQWVLLDSGFNVDTVRDSERRAAQYNYDSYTAVVPPGDPLADQVRQAGLDWRRLAGCALSHLHLDHSGGLRLLPPGTPVILQRAEWTFATTVADKRHAYAREDYLRPGLAVRLIDGDTALAPGLTALDTRGHTPGHQSFRIDVPGCAVVLACDAADLRINLTGRRRCGWIAEPGLAGAAQRAVERLAGLAESGEAEVWPGHDPGWWAWQSQGLYPTR